MQLKTLVKLIFVLLLGLLSAACTGKDSVTPLPSPTATQVPTATPTPKPTNTPTPTLTPTNTPTPTPTFTPTPVPVCKPGSILWDETDESLPGYLDIQAIATTLEGSRLTVIFKLREIPEEITVNRLEDSNVVELAWGVDIDKDNDSDTGWNSFLGSGFGYERELSAEYDTRPGKEITGSIQKIFRTRTYVWYIYSDYVTQGSRGTLIVDPEARTLTLKANIPGITPDAYLSFFTYYTDGSQVKGDALCER